MGRPRGPNYKGPRKPPMLEQKARAEAIAAETGDKPVKAWGRKKTRNAMSFDEMVEEATIQRGQRIYTKTDSVLAKEGGIRDIVYADLEQLSEIADSIGEFRLEDTEAVKQRLALYYRSCAEVGIIPTRIGFTNTLGYTYYAVQHFKKAHPNHPTTVLFNVIADRFSDILYQAGLRGYVDMTLCIFGLKVQYGWQEKNVLAIEQNQPDQLGERRSASELVEQYAYLLDDVVEDSTAKEDSTIIEIAAEAVT